MPAHKGESKTKSARYSRWFRMYDEFICDPKTAMLTDRQGWAWVRILAIAKRSDDGVLPPSKDIAFHLRCSICDAENVVNDLVDLGLLDVLTVNGSGSVIKPHAWDSRQFKWDGRDITQADRKRRSRLRRRTCHSRGHGQVTEVPSESVSVSAYVSSSTEVSIQEVGNHLEVGSTREVRT